MRGVTESISPAYVPLDTRGSGTMDAFDHGLALSGGCREAAKAAFSSASS